MPLLQVQHLLALALDVLNGEGAVEAYKALSQDDRARLRFLGPSFVMKFLYFAGWRLPPAERPLILDRFVGSGLTEPPRWRLELDRFFRKAIPCENRLSLVEAVRSAIADSHVVHVLVGPNLSSTRRDEGVPAVVP